jgi:RNA polymerase sigma factor (sigma-70 family)
MTTHPIKKVVEHLRLALHPNAHGLTDGQLLERFVAERDEVAFAALVQRHGRLVFGVCCRLLGHVQDAEDAFQATFLVLARKAASLSNGEAVGNWLHGVAYRIALDAKVVNTRRNAREKQVVEMPHPEVVADEPQDWRPWLDYEINLLPEKYRTPVVLCELEGRTRREVAHQLGLSEGTLSSRLAAARQLLAKRLSRRGLTLSGGVLAAAVAEEAVAAHIPEQLLSCAARAAVHAVALSSSVETLMKGALKTMYLSELKRVVGVVLVVAALGASGLVYRASGQDSPSRLERPSAQATPGAEKKKPLSEVEALRRENELLKLNMEVLLEKIRAQEGELRSLRGTRGEARKPEDPKARRDETKSLLELERKTQPKAGQRDLPDVERLSDQLKQLKKLSSKEFEQEIKSKVLRELETALKELSKAGDGETQRAVQEALEEALKELRKEMEKPEDQPRRR